MPLACIHTHTFFCDGNDSIETYCRTAFEKGFSCLGFSAHAPFPKETGMHNPCNLDEDRVEAYIEEVLAAKKRWQDKLRIYLGMEVDFIENLTGPADKYYQKFGLDYTIGSVHYVTPPKGEPFPVDHTPEVVERGIREGYGGNPLGMVEDYLNAQIAMIRLGGFDLLGHPDLVKKNNLELRRMGKGILTEDEEFYRKKTALIAELMAGTGIAAEVNTGGLNRGKTKDCFPSLPFLKLFRENAVPMVINADAHRAADLDGHYDAARKAMLEAGYTESLIFQGRENGRAVWRAEEL